MNATNHYELLKLKSAEQKKKTKPEPSTNSSGGLRLAEQITNVKQGAFYPKDIQTSKATAKVVFVVGEKDHYKYGMGDTPVYQRPGSDHSHIKSRGM